MAENEDLKRSWEIEVYEQDETPDGTLTWRVKTIGGHTTISASSPQELNMIKKTYEDCGEKVKFIREVTPPDVISKLKELSKPKNDKLSNSQQNQSVIPQNNQAIPESTVINSEQNSLNKQNIIQQQTIKQNNIIYQKSKPKIVTIGDMQLKYDGDKVYQKQWIKLNSVEAANFRVVNDSNNKIVNLSGKSIEARKWVLVEETKDESEETSAEALLNN